MLKLHDILTRRLANVNTKQWWESGSLHRQYKNGFYSELGAGCRGTSFEFLAELSSGTSKAIQGIMVDKSSWFWSAYTTEAVIGEEGTRYYLREELKICRALKWQYSNIVSRLKGLTQSGPVDVRGDEESETDVF
jgi:hypothetical protein